MSSSAIFTHLPLDRPQEQIRLVEILPGSSREPIRCKLRDALSNGAVYVALSYQWGSSADVDLKQIELNFKPFRVTSNLYAFLLVARSKRETTSLWIDAICIDQSNIAERNELVKRMSHIYSTAREVWVWLGDLSPVSPISVSKMFDLSQPAAMPDLSERARFKIQKWRNEGSQAWLQTVQSICSLGYWDRLWIVQEFLKANLVLVWVGNDIVQGTEFSAFIVESANPRYLYPPRPVFVSFEPQDSHDQCDLLNGIIDWEMITVS